MSKNLLELRNISHSFIQGGKELKILKNINLLLKEGEVVALLGPSGSGKSTILHISGLLEKPSSGDVFIYGTNCTDLKDKQKTALRAQKIGFVYQYHHLLCEFSAKENIMLPQLINNFKKKIALHRSSQLLNMMKLRDRASHKPSELSGGEQQRVAIARALANNPDLLLADEPTGNLDPKTSMYIFNLLKKLVQEIGISLLFATHNLELARQANRCLVLDNGTLKSVDMQPSL